MEKILLAMDPVNLKLSTIDFSSYLAKLTHSHLTGAFLEGLESDQPLVDNNRWRLEEGAQAARLVSGEQGQPAIVVPGDPDIDLVTAGIRQFREACFCRETFSRVHRDRGIPLSELVAESRFADLIIIDPDTSFSRTDRSIPGRFVKDVLQASECPVIVAPYSFDGLDEIIFAYDGSASSVFAIKQFTYLFPELRTKKVSVVNVRHDDVNAIEDQFKMKEWLKDHYGKTQFVVLKGDPADELFGYLIEKKRAIVIVGAYGRSMLSRFFKPSQARLIVKTINLPVFIAHR
jgi:hypothetical protein